MKKNHTIILIGLLIVASVTTITHWPALKASALMFDDDQYLINNRLVKNPSLSSAGIFLKEVLAPSTVRGYYQPLAMISLMLDVKTGASENNLKPFRQTSLALHITNSLLVVIFFYLLFGSPLAAIMIGILYGLSPTTIESVAWLSERKTLLACFFALLSLISYLLSIKKNPKLFYILSLTMYVLALMSKPSIIALPILFLLLDYWPLNRISKKAFLEKIPFFVIASIFACITYISQSGTSGVRLPAQTGILNILFAVCYNILFYLKNLVWPVNLSWYYPYPDPFNLSNTVLIIGLVGTIILLAVLALSLRWTKSLVTGWLFFFLAILPAIGIIGFQPVIAADRHLYFPMIGLLLPVAFLLTKLLNTAKTYIHLVVISIIVIISVFQFRLTQNYLSFWKNSEKLYKYMLNFSPDVTILHNNLANFLKDNGQLTEAVDHYKRSLQLDPDSAAVYNNLGNAYRQLGSFDQAVDAYKKALQFQPNLEYGHFNLASVLATNIKTPQALALAQEEYKKAIRLDPFNVDAMNGLAALLTEKGQTQEAIEYYNMAVKVNPNNITAHGNLVLLLAAKGQLEDALNHGRIVVTLSPGDLEMRCNVGIILERLGRPDQAIAEYKAVLKINPNYPKAIQLLQADTQKK